MKKCDAINCTAQVFSTRFMCLKHWLTLPAATQRAINSGYRRHSNARTLLRDERYVEACAGAIEFVATQEGQPTANSYRHLAELLKSRSAV